MAGGSKPPILDVGELEPRIAAHAEAQVLEGQVPRGAGEVQSERAVVTKSGLFYFVAGIFVKYFTVFDNNYGYGTFLGQSFGM